MSTTTEPKLRLSSRERQAILASLGAGVVPHLGLQHIQVGRKDEVAALIEDLKRVEQAASSVRFVVGPFGSGKSFFLNLLQTVALQRKFVVVRADITTQRRLHSTGGEARSLYTELMRNLATRSKPEGAALGNLVERWVGDVAHEVTAAGGNDEQVALRLAERCRPLQDLVSGYDFASVLAKYYQGYLRQDERLQTAAIRWLRAEYANKTEARQELGVRSIIDDAAIYDYLKLLARFVRIAGYSGLLVCLDELVVLSHRLNNRIARNNNYEAILRIVNDCLQGSVEGLFFVFGATDDSLLDRRRGLFSYEALASRLAENRFASAAVQDLSGPVLRLKPLTEEELYVLLHKLRHVHAGGEVTRYALPDEAIHAYLNSCSQRLGANYFQTPREVIKDFIGLLNILQQHPDMSWSQCIEGITTTTLQRVDPNESPDGDGGGTEDDMASFRL